jgi:hypothetical protein
MHFYQWKAFNVSVKNMLLNLIEIFILHAILAMLQCCEVGLILGGTVEWSVQNLLEMCPRDTPLSKITEITFGRVIFASFKSLFFKL